MNLSRHSFFYLLIILSISILEALIDCDDVVNDNTPFTGKCNNKWKNLKSLIRRK